jgi:hypothetical protein
MIDKLWSYKGMAVTIAVVTLACLALAVGLAIPEPIPNAALGPDWQCTRFAFVFTACSRVGRAVSAIDRVVAHNEPVCLPQRPWHS